MGQREVLTVHAFSVLSCIFFLHSTFPKKTPSFRFLSLFLSKISGLMQVHQGYALRKKLGFLEICLLHYWLIFNVLIHPPSFLVYYIFSYLCCFPTQALSFQNSLIFNLKRGRNAVLLT